MCSFQQKISRFMIFSKVFCMRPLRFPSQYDHLSGHVALPSVVVVQQVTPLGSASYNFKFHFSAKYRPHSRKFLTMHTVPDNLIGIIQIMILCSICIVCLLPGIHLYVMMNDEVMSVQKCTIYNCRFYFQKIVHNNLVSNMFVVLINTL